MISVGNHFSIIASFKYLDAVENFYDYIMYVV